MDDRVEALVRRLHLPCTLCPNAPGPGQLCARGLSIRTAVRAGIELAAEVLYSTEIDVVVRKEAVAAIRALIKEKP